MMRTVVAMSGGVDSSVAAALLAEAGADVIGLSMQVYDRREGTQGFGSCCSPDDLHDARRVASHLGMPHYVVNYQRAFREKVIDNFVAEYAAGRTPIPCVHCNADLKFATLLDQARGLGADRVATGHYARVARHPDAGTYSLQRGIDRSRDQAYFLFSLDQAQLAAAVFPVGHLTKAEVRAHARRLRLPVADKPESREICFVPDGDYARFVEREGGSGEAGLIVDATGRVLGEHAGVHRFTVGQRKGLGLAAGRPLYVTHIDAPARRVTVGPRETLGCRTVKAADVTWIAGGPPAAPIRGSAQIRYRHQDAAAAIAPTPDGRGAVVEFDEPQTAVAPGQAVVFYQGETVVGGGWIK